MSTDLNPRFLWSSVSNDGTTLKPKTIPHINRQPKFHRSAHDVSGPHPSTKVAPDTRSTTIRIVRYSGPSELSRSPAHMAKASAISGPTRMPRHPGARSRDSLSPSTPTRTYISLGHWLPPVLLSGKHSSIVYCDHGKP